MDDFGGKLRQARERRGISLRQVAANTKIAAAALDALERNDVSKLPGGIFSRAFVRSYAIEVGLDPVETVREFTERFHQEPPPSTEAIAAAIPEQERTFLEQQRKAARTLTIAGVSLVVVLAAAFLILRSRGKQASPVIAVAAAPESPPPAAAEASRATPPPSASEAARATPPPAAAEAARTPPPPAASEVIRTPPPVESQRDAGAPSASARVVPAAVQLDIHPTSDCWVSLTVDGTKLFSRVMKPGEHESHAVEHDAVVEIGDAGAFAFSVDGRDGKPVGDSGQVATLRLTPATAKEYVR